MIKPLEVKYAYSYSDETIVLKINEMIEICNSLNQYCDILIESLNILNEDKKKLEEELKSARKVIFSR